MPSSASDSLIGTRLGAYRVDALLGSGGMGEVFRGVHEALARPVAIKTLRPELAVDRTAVERFFAEARAVNVIRHENIVEVTDLVSQASGHSYMVMELLEGCTLTDAIRQAGRIPAERAVGIAAQVADALGAAHDKGIIHRDLKPDNVFLIRRAGSADYVKLLDFGIARLRPEVGGLGATQTGALLGTPAYMSPEQAEGTAVTHAADIYTLGVLLFHMLTGRLPFEGKSLPEVMYGHLALEPPSVGDLAPEVPAALVAVIESALAKKPADRPASMASMRTRLLASVGMESAERADTDMGRAATMAAVAAAQHTAPTADPPRRRVRLIAAALAAAVAMGALMFALVRGQDAGGHSAVRTATSGSAAALVVQPAGVGAGTAPGSDVDALRRRLNQLTAGHDEPAAPRSCQTRDARLLRALVQAAEALVHGAPGSARPRDRQAVDTLSEVRAGGPEAAEAAEYWHWLAKARLYDGRDAGAVTAAAERAGALCDGYAAPHSVAGTALFRAGRAADAEGHYRAALAMDDAFSTARYNLALVELELGRIDQGIDSLTRVLADRPDSADALLARGQAYLMARDVTAAVGDLERATRADPRNNNGFWLLGLAYQQAGRSEDAQRALCTAGELGHARAAERCDR